jgi:hypothetical protein
VHLSSPPHRTPCSGGTRDIISPEMHLVHRNPYTKDRATENALTASVNHVFNVMVSSIFGFCSRDVVEIAWARKTSLHRSLSLLSALYSSVKGSSLFFHMSRAVRRHCECPRIIIFVAQRNTNTKQSIPCQSKTNRISKSLHREYYLQIATRCSTLTRLDFKTSTTDFCEHICNRRQRTHVGPHPIQRFFYSR